MGHDIEELGKHIRALEVDINKLGGDEWKELWKAIHCPGWTTPAEFRLVSSVVAHMTAQVAALADLRQSLVHASREIGAKKIAAK